MSSTPSPGRIYISKIDLTTAAIREMILGGELKPGTPLRQRDLAKRLGVSVTPVREALRRLESEEIVAFNAHTGATVIKVDYGPTRENFLIRASLEALASEFAAPKISTQQISELIWLNEQMRECGTRDLQNLGDLNRRFHFLIYDATDLALLNSLIRRLWQSFGHGPLLLHNAEESLLQHAEIIEALRDGDADAAGRATRNHILTGMHRANVDSSPVENRRDEGAHA
jgi:DNA-binding GntR family transcriptional regulator